MSVLSGPEIVRLVNRTRAQAFEGHPPLAPAITIEPFDAALAGPNSYDIHLSAELAVYKIRGACGAHPELFETDIRTPKFDAVYDSLPLGVDMEKPPDLVHFQIPAEGFWLRPGVLYLGATIERTECHGLVPWLDGRSSIGRLGLSVHVTAGRGDDGWPGRWTLEITAVAHPVKVYAGKRIGQLTYFTLEGERKPYTGHYRNQDGPTGSRLHEDRKLD